MVHGRIHSIANHRMRSCVFPHMREDQFTDAVRYDYLAISYGNNLCEKYRKQHLLPMIRSKLRLIGRFLLKIKDLNKEVDQFSDVFRPKFYKDVVKAIHAVAGLDEQRSRYRAPATAFALGTLLKKCAKFLEIDLISLEDFEKQNQVINFIKIMEVDLPSSVNKTVEENQEEMKRVKKLVLPKTNEIKKLIEFLNQKINTCLRHIKTSVTLEIWKSLASYVLVAIHVFNRKRPGEVSRMLIEDFNNYETFDNDDKEATEQLSSRQKLAAKKYVRFIIRGKRNRTVAVLLSKKLLSCVKIILQHRRSVGVLDKNPFVFGLPSDSGTIFKYLQSDILLRKFSQECGISNHKFMRSTNLRKHMATRSSLLRLKDDQISGIARFMGHQEAIHKKHYVTPVATREIVEVSQILEVAQGKNVTRADNSNSINEKDISRVDSFTDSINDTDLSGIDTFIDGINNTKVLGTSASSTDSIDVVAGTSGVGNLNERSIETDMGVYNLSDITDEDNGCTPMGDMLSDDNHESSSVQTKRRSGIMHILLKYCKILF